MSKKEKLMRRIQSHPKDFTFDEVETLLGYFDYKRLEKGRTSGSRIIFVSDKHPPILIHKPHPRKELLDYQIKQLTDVLEGEGLI